LRFLAIWNVKMQEMIADCDPEKCLLELGSALAGAQLKNQ
jgi:hypothetical protein